MKPRQPIRSVADVIFNKMVSGAVYGAGANIYRPSTVADMELSTAQCLLLALVHSLVEGDLMFSTLLADISYRVEKLRSRYLKVWLVEDFEFPRRDIESATCLLAQLITENSLRLPEHVMTIMASLAKKYGIKGVQLRTLSKESRCCLASQLENAVTNNCVKDIFELESEGANVCGVTLSGESLIHLATRLDNSSSIAALGFLKVDLEDLNSSNATPLEEAVKNNCVHSVKALLSAGAEVEKRLPGGDTYLHVAAAGGHNEALEVLLENVNDVDIENDFAETPLIKSAKAGNFRGIELLLEKDADPVALLELLIDGESILHSVARSGNFKILKLLIYEEHEIPADMKNHSGLTPLHLACNLSIARALVRMGLNIEEEDNEERTPLMTAAKNKKADIVNLLLLNGASLKAKDQKGWSALHYAAEAGCADSATFLLDADKGPDRVMVDCMDDNSETPAFIAAKNNNLAVLRVLVENGTDLAWENCDGMDILHVAARYGNVEVVKALLQYGVEVKGINPMTALHYAAQEGHIEVVTALIDAGADVDMVDHNGHSALYYASEGGHTAVVAVLLDHGANPNAGLYGRLYEGSTPLMVASKKDHIDVVKLLVERGADVRMKDNTGRTALEIAKGLTQVVEYLRSIESTSHMNE